MSEKNGKSELKKKGKGGNRRGENIMLVPGIKLRTFKFLNVGAVRACFIMKIQSFWKAVEWNFNSCTHKVF